MIFSRTKQGADTIANQLLKSGIAAKAFHADLSQGAREQVLQDFKAGNIKALVATDVALTLYSEEDALLLEEVEAVLDLRLPQQWLPGLKPDLTKSAPVLKKNTKAAQKQRAKKRALGQTRSKSRR